MPTLSTTKIIHEIQQLIKQTKILVYITWVKGHANIEGNTLVDAIANETAQYKLHKKNLQIKLPHSYLNKILKIYEKEKWQTQWDITECGRYTYNIIKNVDYELHCPDRVSLYFLTGNGSFPTFLHKVGKKDNDLCQCGKRGDPIHYLFKSCPFMKYKFKYKKDKTLIENIHIIQKDKTLLNKLYENYNILNNKYSFINYKFLT